MNANAERVPFGRQNTEFQPFPILSLRLDVVRCGAFDELVCPDIESTASC